LWRGQTEKNPPFLGKDNEQTIFVHLLFELFEHKKSSDVEAFIELSCKGSQAELCERVKAKLTRVEPRGGCGTVISLLSERMQLVWHVKTGGGQAAPRRHVHALKLPNDLDPFHIDLFSLVLSPAIVKNTKEEEPDVDKKEDEKEARKEEGREFVWEPQPFLFH